jgi:hypothetical protein
MNLVNEQQNELAMDTATKNTNTNMRTKQQPTTRTKHFLTQGILILLLLVAGGKAWGQSTNDFRTRASGNWNNTNTWERYNGATWTNDATYPGQNTGTGTVTIRNGHTVTLNITPVNSIGSLVVDSDASDAYLNFSGTNELIVTGSTTCYGGTGNGDEGAIRLDAGRLTTTSISLTGEATDSRDAYIRISTGTCNVYGDISLNSSNLRSYILFTNTGTLNLYGTITGTGNITSVTGGSSNAPTSGTVNYNNTGDQTIGNYSYYNLEISGSGIKDLGGNVTVNNNLNLTAGTLSIDANTLSLADGSTITYNSGTITGGATSNLTIGTGTDFTLNSITGGLNNLTTARNLTLGADLTLAGALSYGTTTYTVGANTLTLNGGAISGTSANFITSNSSNLVFGGSSTGVIIPSGVTSLNSLTINNTNGVTANSSISVANDIILTNGTLSLGTNNLNFTGTTVCGAGQISATGGTVTITGSANTNIPKGTYYNLTINRTAGTTVSMCGDITVSNLLTLTSGTLAIGLNTLTLNGPALTGTPTNLTSTSFSNLSFGGSSTGIFIPSSISSLNNLTINNSNGVSLNGALTVNNQLALTSGKLLLGSNNLTFADNASVSGTLSASNMIDIGTGSITKTGSSNANFIFTYPLGIGSSYTPFQISSLSATTISPSSSITVRSSAVVASGVPGTHPLVRNWVTSTSGISGSVLAGVGFTYVAADITGTAVLYELVYKPASASWAIPGGSGAAGSNPLTASAATSLDATWTATEPQKRVFYSLKSGSWDDPACWTLDPSGTQILNPNNYTPTTSPTAVFDDVFILSGRTITAPTNAKSNNDLTVVGTLDFGTTFNHSFATINGTGRIRLAGDNFPIGNATDFVTAGQGQGTVEYYGSTRKLTTVRTFYNVEVNLTSANTLSLLKDYTINGNWTIANGTFSINDNTTTSANLNITVYGNLTVASTGKIITGQCNTRHQLNLYGDFTNSGDVRFTNRSTANYTTEATDGIVDVNFLNSEANQSLMCRGITNFYRVKIDKGTDMTYTLNIDATSNAYFKLYGFANEDHSSSPAQLATNSNAFALLHGTARIGNSVEIPVLSNANIYNISTGAQLWVDRGTVQKNLGTAININGKIKITNGTLEAKVQSGISFMNTGILEVSGGIVNVNQIRTVDGATNYGGYVQTAGTVNVLGGTTNTDYYVFSLPFGNSVFNMSGGILNVNTSTGNGGILINSDAENIKVSGGTVNAITNSTDDFIITSTSPFWNLNLKNTSSAARQFLLSAASNIGSTNVNVAVQPLKVLNDVRIWGTQPSYSAASFVTGTTDVYIGGSFYIENGSKYVPISGGTSPYDATANQPTSKNTTYFNKTAGTGAIEELYQGDPTNPLEFGNIVVDRTSGYELKMTSDNARTDESVVLDINGNASVLSGTLNQNLFTIRTWGAITNNDRMGTWFPGTTPSHAQIQLVENPALTLTTSSNAVFGNVQINSSTTSKIILSSNVYIERMEYLRGLIYLKGYNLKVDYLWNLESGLFENSAASSYLKVANSSYSASSMIYSDGKASDGGLSIKIIANSQAENENNRLNNFGPVTYPIGFTTGGTNLYFRPAQVVVKNFSDDGYLTIRAVSGALQTTNQTGGEVLQHYWRVSHSGFTSLPTVAYRFYYRNQIGGALVDLPTGSTNEATYVPGKVLDEMPYTRSYEPVADADILRTFEASGNSRILTINSSSTNGLFSPSSTGITIENANYTAGLTTRFSGSVLIYYSRDNQQQANWNDGNSWTRSDILNVSYAPHDSRQPAAGTWPGAGDVAVIGWVPWTDANKPALLGQPHCIWIGSYSQSAAEVVFTKMTDASGNPVARVYRSNFQFRPTLCIDQPTGQLVAKLVKGEGLFWNRQSDPDYTQMDIGDFAREDSSYVIYENFTNNRTISKTPALFPNLYISNDNWGGNDLNFTFSNNLVTTGNIELLGNVNLLLNNGTTGDITVGRNLVFFEKGTSGGGARIDYPNSGTARKIIVKGDVYMRNGSSIIQVVSPNSTAPLLDNELHVYGNIEQGTAALASTGLDLWSGANNDRITLYLDGSSNMTYTKVNGTNPDLYRLVVNKGNSQASTAQFNTQFTLNGPTSGVGVKKALELQNGTFIVNNASQTLNLTTGNDFFEIPSTAGLELKLGTANATGTSGISLDGKLTISGGTLNMAGGDNPIEYSASGNASIAILSGTLTVGGQIRRSATSDVGILNYNQSGGTVVVGNNTASVGNRGVFEILNAGSSFTMTGGDLYIARAQTSPTISAFYFNPATSNISTSANIHIGYSSTIASQNFGIYAGKPLPNLRINNTWGKNPIAKLEIVPATITSLLQIDAGSSFNCNGNDLTLKGNMTASGTFIPNGNTTYLSGASSQIITGNSATLNFYNLDKTSSNTVSLAAGVTPVTVNNALYLRAGTLNDNSNTITALADVLNDATHVYTAGTGDGILMKGTTNQVLTGNGTFGKLTINNLNGVNIPIGNHLTVTQKLVMSGGILNIGKNLFDIGVNGVIEPAIVPFSKTNMIETNISFTDYGLRKTFPSVVSPTTLGFIFPVGNNDKYTPVTLNITANGNSTGSITVKPANEVHASIIEDTETGTQIVDKNNALQYYWTLKATGMTGFSASAKMRYISADAIVTPPYTVADYITARLLADGSGLWNKFNKTDFDETNLDLIYSFSLKSDAEISGDYTAGAADDAGFLNGAIPDQVAKYETNTNGDWTTLTIWTPTVSGGPSGAIAKINSGHIVDVSTNYLTGYLTEILGTLKLGYTYGHRLGIVNGTGTINLLTGDIPAAVYDNFFSSAGGTLEFDGTTNYEFLGNIIEVNNIKLLGFGDRKFPNNNITLNGSLLINGTSALNVINYYNRTVYIKGDLTRTIGNFEAGSDANATLSFNGTLTQTITGSFSNSNALNNLEVNNANDINCVNDVEIDRELKLSNGLINVGASSLFRMNYGSFVTPTAGSQTSFVNGVLTKEMINGNSFMYPIGNNTGTKAYGPIGLVSVLGPTGLNDWKASYYFADATMAGYNTLSFDSPITTVSKSEYWKIEAPTGGSSGITIPLDGSSDVATIPDMTQLRVVGWNPLTSKWEVVGSSTTVTGTATSGSVTTTGSVNYGSYSYFTLASVTPVAAASATITSSATVSICSGTSTTISLAFTGEAPYILNYKEGSTNKTTPGITTSTYNLTVSPTSTTVYTLISMTANGNAGTVNGTTVATITVNPIPTVTLASSLASPQCEGTSITFTANSGLANYKFRVNGTVDQNNAANIYSKVLSVGTQSIDVIGTNSGGCSATSSAIAVTINPKPSTAGAISGQASVCKGTNNVTYTVPVIANATSYSWSINGASGSSVTNSITPTFTNSGNTVLKVKGVNTCTQGAESSYTVAVNTASTPGTPGTITSVAEVCKGGTGYTLSVGAVANATSYNWSFGSGGTGATFNGTSNSITVDYSATATSGNITVAATNGCSTVPGATPFAVTVFTPPTASITPATPSTCSTSSVELTASPSGGTGLYTHLWSGAGSGSLTSTNAINPSFSNTTDGTYALTYTVTDAKGCKGSANTTVTVYQAPVADAGPDALGLCSGTNAVALTGATASGSYSGTPTWSGSGGSWTQSPDPALATFKPSTVSGSTTVTLTLTGANGCTNATDNRVISWSKVPDQPSTITGYATVCYAQTNVLYSVTNDPMATSYAWSYSGGTGATINGTTNSVSVDYLATATAGQLTVIAQNTCGNSTSRSLSISPATRGIWAGNTNSDWVIVSNWSCPDLPLTTTDVVIPFTPNQPVIATDVACNKLTIDNNASLTINPKYSLTLSGDFVNNGAIILKSDATGTGSFLDNGTITQTGTATAERYLSTNKYHYISSPLNGMKANDVAISDHYYYYDESVVAMNNDWMKGWIKPGVKDMTPALGFALYNGAEAKLLFNKGKFNYGDIPISLSYTVHSWSTANIADGWNLIGNPYPSAIDADAFITANKDYIEGALYFWTYIGNTGWNLNGSDYACYTLAGGAGSKPGTNGPAMTSPLYIAQSQGFFVRKISTSTHDVIFSNSMRTVKPDAHFFKGEKDIQRAYMSLTNKDSLYNQILLAFTDESTMNYDNGWDAVKLRGNTKLALYSLSEAKECIIQAQPKVVDEDRVIPLGFEAKVTGDLTMNLESLEKIEPSLNIYLIDKLTNKITNLRKQKSYAFYSGTGIYQNRFKVVFTAKDMEETTKLLAGEVKVYANDRQVIVELPASAKDGGQVRIFDLLGNMVVSRPFAEEYLLTIPLNVKGGIYLVEVKTTESKTVGKVYINQ